MKLTEDEREVLSCMYFRAEMPMREVAQQTGLREHVVRRCIDKLLDRKIIRHRIFVNPFAVGLSEYMVFIGTQMMSQVVRQRLLSCLLESSHTTYVGTIGGDFHLAVMLVARDLNEVTVFLDTLSAAAQGSAYVVSTASCTSVSFFVPKFLGAGNYGPSSVAYGLVKDVVTLDAIDNRILHALGTLTTGSLAGLARQLGLPSSTVTYRLESLKERGVVVGIGFALPPFKDGLYACALQVCAGSMPAEVRQKFRDYCSKHPAISYSIEALGGWNFQIGARLEDSRQATVLADDLQQRFAPYVSNVSLIPVHEALKVFPHPLMAQAYMSERENAA